MPFYRVLITASCLAFGAISPGSSFAGPRATLKKLTAELQSSPDNRELREKIIKLALTLKPAPATPEEAQRRMARGSAAVKGAENEGDFKDAVEEFEKAALAAPWLADAYYNLGVAQDKAGEHAAAIQNLKLYLVAAPGTADAKTAKSLIYEIEFRQEKAAKREAERSRRAAAEADAEKQKEIETFLSRWARTRGNWVTRVCTGRGLEGGDFWYRYDGCNAKEWENGWKWMSSGGSLDYNKTGTTISIGVAGGLPGVKGKDDGQSWRILGFVKGPSVDEIEWQCKGKDGTTRDPWTKIKGETSLIFSCDREWDFDASESYGYFWINKE